MTTGDLEIWCCVVTLVCVDRDITGEGVVGRCLFTLCELHIERERGYGKSSGY